MPDGNSRECQMIMDRLDSIDERLARIEIARAEDEAVARVEARFRQWIGGVVLTILSIIGSAVMWFTTGGGEDWLRKHL